MAAINVFINGKFAALFVDVENALDYAELLIAKIGDSNRIEIFENCKLVSHWGANCNYGAKPGDRNYV